MIARNQLMREIETLPAECIDEVLDFVGFIKSKRLKDVPDTMLVSEAALARDWDTPEEDAAWTNL